MGIEAKHAYRFGYLKSEEWKTVRVEALAREKGKCQICGEESVSNDAHHIWYPESIYETTVDHLVILCRPCHDFVHAMLPDCKGRDEEAGREQWTRFRNAVVAWRLDKLEVFNSGERIVAADLRKAYAKLKAQLKEYEAGGTPPLPPPPKTPDVNQQIREVLKHIGQWAAAYKALLEHANISIDTPGDNANGHTESNAETSEHLRSQDLAS